MSNDKTQAKFLRLPNSTNVLSEVAAIGKALEEMCLAERGTARRLVLKDRAMALVADVADAAYHAGVMSTETMKNEDS